MKVSWDSGQGTGTTSVAKIAKHFKWTPWHKYHDQTLMPHKEFTNGFKLFRHGSTYYLKNTNNEVARIPNYVATTLEHKEQVTYIIGPFIFINGFEESAEGKYLRKIFPYYFNMSPRTQEKVNKIMEMYDWWVRLHDEYIEIMKKVENGRS